MTAIPGTDPIRSHRGTRANHRPIAVVLSRFPSVTETFILREIIEMERQGQQVRLVPMLKDDPPVVHEEAKPWTGRALFTPFFSPSIAAANLRAFLRAPQRYLALLGRLAFETIPSPPIFLRTLAIFPKSVFIAERLQKEGIRHIHAHFATHPATIAMIAASLTPITFSFTVHAHDVFVNRRLLRWKIRKAEFVRSVSEFNRRFLEERYPEETESKIRVVHVGLDPRMYGGAFPPGQRGEPAAPRILTVAAYKPYKGLPVLIEACRLLRDAGVPFQCDIVGHGPMERALRRQVAAAALQDAVHLVSPRPQDEIAELMARCSLFVLPSTIASDGQMEGIPVALMEAMATGRPVISTAISGIPELIEDGVSGLLVEPDDASALAGAIRSVLADPEAAAAWGERAREKICSQFDVRWCVRQLLGRLAEAERSDS